MFACTFDICIKLLLTTYLLTYHCNLFCCITKIMSSNPSLSLNYPSLSLNSLLGTLAFTLKSHICLTILICAHWSATSLYFFFRPGLTSMQHTSLHTTTVQSQPVLVTGFKQPIQINDLFTLEILPFIPLHFLCTHFWQLVHCTEYWFRTNTSITDTT